MMFAHIHSTKEKLYGLFNLHVQLDFTIGVLYALDILDKNTDIVTLTTQIYDTAWKRNRLDRTSVKLEDDLYECKMPELKK